jgi:hypothetical protein
LQWNVPSSIYLAPNIWVGLKLKKGRHERYSVRAGRPVTQLGLGVSLEKSFAKPVP